MHQPVRSLHITSNLQVRAQTYPAFQHAFRSNPPHRGRCRRGWHSAAQGRRTSWIAAQRSADTPAVAELNFRQATDADLPNIANAVLREKMNPLGLKAERFVVAVRRSDGEIQGFGQLAPLGGAPQGGPERLELRSLIVEPAHRGSGVGKALLAELVRRAQDAEIYMTTLGSTTGFYSPQGFQLLSPREIPGSLLFEWLAGNVVARIATGQPCVVMRRAPG